MALYLDSALVTDAQRAGELGWVSGITTNPSLLAKSGLDTSGILERLARAIPGEVFYQLVAPDLDGMLVEGRQACKILGKQAVLKIPATPIGFQALARLSREAPCAVTAIYSPAQALVAAAVGARYALVYVNRATHLMGDGLALVTEIAGMLDGSSTALLAASIKSPQEAVATYRAGAPHLTLPLNVLEALTEHELTARAVEEFADIGRGISI
jgi:transaldolase